MKKEKVIIRVRLEPQLEEVAGKMTPAERRTLARKHERWAHQLKVSADVIDAHSGPKPKPRLRYLPECKCARN